MSGWKLIPLKRTKLVRVFLRRYKVDSTCPGRHGYHNAMVAVETEAGNYDEDGILLPPDGKRWADHSDPNWPRKCAYCGYEFQPDDTRQVSGEPLWELPNGKMTTLRDAPVGSCWTADWLDDICCPNNRNQIGWPLMVRLPGPPNSFASDWLVDARSASGGQGWTRSGNYESMTATPSICIPAIAPGMRARYHGWLRDGILTPCCEGNLYPDLPFTA